MQSLIFANALAVAAFCHQLDLPTNLRETQVNYKNWKLCVNVLVSFLSECAEAVDMKVLLCPQVVQPGTTCMKPKPLLITETK